MTTWLRIFASCLLLVFLCLTATAPAVAQPVPPPVAPAPTVAAQPAVAPEQGPRPAVAPQPPRPPKPAALPQAATPPEPPEANKAATPPPPPRQRVLPLNARIEVTITDQTGSAQPVRKTVTMVVADGGNAMIRSEARLLDINVPLYVDARDVVISPEIDKVRLQLSLEYRLADAEALKQAKAAPINQQPWTTEIRESTQCVLENGKPLVIAQSADPFTDRKVTVEAKATILK